MFISVIIPFHNVERYIRRCVEAVLAASYPKERYEIILIDNNSTDGSAAMAAEYPQVRIISESKRGAYAARNRGVAASSGALLAFTDSDCAPHPDWLERIEAAAADPAVQLVQGRQRFARQSIPLDVLNDYDAEKAAFVFSSQTAGLYYGYTNNMVVRRSAFERAGPFMELQRGADVIFVQRVVSEYSTAAVVFRPDVAVQHLEITRPWDWLRKMCIYGRSWRRYSTIVNSRPLSTWERLRVLRSTIEHGRFSVTESLTLSAMLAAGLFSYELGRWWPTRS